MPRQPLSKIDLKTTLDTEVENMILKIESEKLYRLKGENCEVQRIDYLTPKGERGYRLHFRTVIDGLVYIKLVPYGPEQDSYDWILAKDQ